MTSPQFMTSTVVQCCLCCLYLSLCQKSHTAISVTLTSDRTPFLWLTASLRQKTFTHLMFWTSFSISIATGMLARKGSFLFEMFFYIFKLVWFEKEKWSQNEAQGSIWWVFMVAVFSPSTLWTVVFPPRFRDCKVVCSNHTLTGWDKCWECWCHRESTSEYVAFSFLVYKVQCLGQNVGWKQHFVYTKAGQRSSYSSPSYILSLKEAHKAQVE